MTPTIKVTQDGIRTMAAELSRLSGKDYAFVLRNFAAQVAKTAALDSSVASKAAITRQITERFNSWAATHDTDTSDQKISVNVRKSAGRVWFLNKETGKAYMIFDAGPSRGNHVPDAIWKDYLTLASQRSALLKARITEIQKHRGLERVSWLQIGDGLGVPLGTVSPAGNLQEDLARGASAYGRQFHNGTARETTTGKKHVVSITNENPIAIKRRGQQRVDSAIQRQFRTFQFALQRGFLDDLKFRSTRWPGIFVQAA